MKTSRHSTIWLFTTLGILAGLVALWWWNRPDTPTTAVADFTPSVTPGATVPAIDRQAFRSKAWQMIAPRLDAADEASRTEIDRSLVQLSDFFAARQPGIRPLAEAVLSLGGKWRFVKAKLPFTDGEGHMKYLQEQFAEHLFAPDDLRKVLEGTVTSYITRVKGLENQLLVQIRADLSQNELLAAEAIPALSSADHFKQEFGKLEMEVTRMVASQFRFSIGREVAVFVGSEVAAHVAIRVGLGIAQRLGFSAGILASGAAVGWATFGVGLVAAIVVDYFVDGVLTFSGYDPTAQVEVKVRSTLKELESQMMDGVPEAWAAYRKLRLLERESPNTQVRAECQAAADRIDVGGQLGLRHELQRLHDLRAKVRREALRRLIQEGQ